jgi:hypothetical protein
MYPAALACDFYNRDEIRVRLLYTIVVPAPPRPARTIVLETRRQARLEAARPDVLADES